jgi:hypothetical protein
MPSLDTFRHCPVVAEFCSPCGFVSVCRLAPHPKKFPAVSAFLQRFNMARVLNQPMWGTDWQDVSFPEWVMLTVATQVVVALDHEEASRLKREARSHGRRNYNKPH